MHRLTMVTGQFIDCTDDQDRAGRVNGDRQEFGDHQVDWGYRDRRVVGQVGDSITGGRSGRQGLVGGRVVGQARG